MANLETFSYDNKIVRNFAWASIIFGVIGMLVGVIVAFQLVFIPMQFFLHL
jgi:cytochrome c oxidase cbb3-type subunit I/II